MTILNAGVNAAYIRFYVQEKTLHEENISYLNYRRDKLMSLFKGEEPVELDYQYSFNAVDEFAEKQISKFESKKQLIKK